MFLVFNGSNKYIVISNQIDGSCGQLQHLAYSIIGQLGPAGNRSNYSADGCHEIGTLAVPCRSSSSSSQQKYLHNEHPHPHRRHDVGQKINFPWKRVLTQIISIQSHGRPPKMTRPCPAMFHLQLLGQIAAVARASPGHHTPRGTRDRCEGPGSRLDAANVS